MNWFTILKISEEEQIEDAKRYVESEDIEPGTWRSGRIVEDSGGPEEYNWDDLETALYVLIKDEEFIRLETDDESEDSVLDIKSEAEDSSVLDQQDKNAIKSANRQAIVNALERLKSANLITSHTTWPHGYPKEMEKVEIYQLTDEGE